MNHFFVFFNRNFPLRFQKTVSHQKILRCKGFKPTKNLEVQTVDPRRALLTWSPKPASGPKYTLLNSLNRKFFWSSGLPSHLPRKWICFSSRTPTSPHSKTSTSDSWKKSVTAFVLLLEAYKKTLRFNWNESLDKTSTSWVLWFAVSPFFGYFFQKAWVDSAYQPNFFLQKALPGVSQPLPFCLTWETFTSSQYSKSLQTALTTQVTDFGDGFLISLNPRWEFQPKQLWTATFPALPSNQTWFFLPSRYFYQLLSESQKKEFPESLKGNVLVSRNSFFKQSQQTDTYQLFLNELDDIPIKLNSIFQKSSTGVEPSPVLTLVVNTTNGFSKPTEKLEAEQLFSETLVSSLTDFQNQFQNLQLNFEKFTIDPEVVLDCQNDLLLEQSAFSTFDNACSGQMAVEQLVSSSSSHKVKFTLRKAFLKLFQKAQKLETSRTGFPKNGFPVSTQTKFLGFLPDASVSFSEISSPSSSDLDLETSFLFDEGPGSDINLLTNVAEETNLSQSESQEELVLEKEDFPGSRETSFNLLETDLDLVTNETSYSPVGLLGLENFFTKQLQKTSNGSNRTFQYIIDLGLTQLESEIQTIAQDPKAPKFLKQALKNDLQTSYSSFGVKCPIHLLEKDVPKTDGFSFLHISHFEKDFREQFSPPPGLLEVFRKNPLELLQAKLETVATLDSEEVFSQKLEETESFDFQEWTSDCFAAPLYLSERKRSGYLYPDSLRSTLFQTFKPLPSFKPTQLEKKPKTIIDTYNQNLSTFRSSSLLQNFPGIWEKGFRWSPKPFNDYTLQISKPLTQSVFTFSEITDKIVTEALWNSQPISASEDSKLFPPLVREKWIPGALDLDQSTSLQSKSPNTCEAPFIEKTGKENQTLDGLTYLKKPKPDQSWTIQKDVFAGFPHVTPVYKLSVEALKKEVKRNEKFLDPSRLLSPYKSFWNSCNFWTFDEDQEGFNLETLTSPKSPSLEKPSFVEPPRSFLSKPLKTSYSPFQFNLEAQTDKKGFNNSGQSFKLDFQELTKVPTFSTVFKKMEDFPFWNPQTKSWCDQNPPLAYKNSFEKLPSSSSQTFYSPGSFLKRKALETNYSATHSLYEPIQFKTWTVFSQLGFFLIFLKLLEFLKKDYTEEILYYIEEFYSFLNKSDKEMLQLLTPDDEIRVVSNTQKKFSDLVGGQSLLAEFGETILNVRNSRKLFSELQISQPFFKGRGSGKSILFKPTLKNDFIEHPPRKFQKLSPKRILVVGPPGTGKTLFVKAFAGEAGLPIIVESGKSLTSNKETEGAQRLKDLFKAAREHSPCILFLDEIDTLGQKRENVVSTSLVSEIAKEIPNPLKTIYLQKETAFFKDSFGTVANSENFQWENLTSSGFQNSTNVNFLSKSTQDANSLKSQLTNQNKSQGGIQNRDLGILTQLLYELDGLTSQQKTMVIGATNRPATLDSALTRPGRFGKILYLDLPGKQKRFELFQFYSQSPLTNLSLREKTKPKLPNEWFSFFHFLNQKKKLLTTSVLKTFPVFEQGVGNVLFTFQVSNPKSLVHGKETSYSPFQFQVFSKRDQKQLSLAYSPKFFDEGFSVRKAQCLKLDSKVDLQYFANQTVGLSSAHIAAAMNQSALKAVFSLISQKNLAVPGFKRPIHLAHHFSKELSTSHPSQTSFKNLPKFFKYQLLTDLTLGKIAPSFQSSKPTSFQPVEKAFAISKFSEPFHTFETLEYGIQTLSKTKLSWSFRFFKSQEVNQMFLGPFAVNDFLIKTKSFKGDTNVQFQTKTQLTSSFGFSSLSFKNEQTKTPADSLTSLNKVQKNLSDKGRARFYRKHRRYFRTLVFLDCQVDFQKLVNLFFGSKRPEKVLAPQVSKPHITLSPAKVVHRYLNRLYKNSFWGWELLACGSTCLVQNPLFGFSVQRQTQKSLSDLSYKVLGLTKHHSLKGQTPSFIHWQLFNESNQKRLFGDSDFLLRSATYLSGKTFLIFLTQLENQMDPSMSLWSFLEKSDHTSAGQSKTFVQKAYLTKNQLERALLCLIAGKATEMLRLHSSFQIINSNFSNHGIQDLKQLTNVINLGRENGFSYSPKTFQRNQSQISFVENTKQLQTKEKLVFFQNLAPFFERTLKTAVSSKSLKSSETFQSLEQPWWQFQTAQFIAFSKFNYGQWYRIFLVDEPSNFRNIEWVSPDDYFHNQTNHSFLTFQSQKLFQLQKKPSLVESLPAKVHSLKFPAHRSSTFHWNHISLLENDFQVSYLVFEAFNKVFRLLENHREWLDFLSYAFLCNENIRPLEILTMHQQFLKKTH